LLSSAKTQKDKPTQEKLLRVIIDSMKKSELLKQQANPLIIKSIFQLEELLTTARNLHEQLTEQSLKFIAGEAELIELNDNQIKAELDKIIERTRKSIEKQIADILAFEQTLQEGKSKQAIHQLAFNTLTRMENIKPQPNPSIKQRKARLQELRTLETQLEDKFLQLTPGKSELETLTKQQEQEEITARLPKIKQEFAKLFAKKQTSIEAYLDLFLPEQRQEARTILEATDKDEQRKVNTLIQKIESTKSKIERRQKFEDLELKLLYIQFKSSK
jgi:hypothetical protein